MEAFAAPRPHRLPESARLLRLAGDDRLVALIRDDSRAAFEAVYERFHRPLLSFCHHMLGNRDDAAEAVQHTFLQAYRELVSTDKPIHLRAWLFTIARNRSLSMLRARREQTGLEVIEPATEGLAAEVERREDLRELVGDLARLPDDQRAAVVLAELGALGHDEIAQVLECPQEKVKALVFQARTSLAASREARSTPCAEIREQLANLHGGALRRGPLRRHLRTCSGCREFGDEVKRQRSAFALILPVVPVAGLKQAILAGAGAGLGGGGAAGGVAAGGGAAAGLSGLGSGVVVKAVLVTAIVGGGAAGGVVVASGLDSHSGSPGQAVSSKTSAGNASVVGAVAASAIAAAKHTATAAAGVASHSAAAHHSGSHGNSTSAHELALSRGHGLKRGLNGTQPGHSDSGPGHKSSSAGSDSGGGQENGSGGAASGNAFGHDKQTAGDSGGQSSSQPPPAPVSQAPEPQGSNAGGNGNGSSSGKGRG